MEKFSGGIGYNLIWDYVIKLIFAVLAGFILWKVKTRKKVDDAMFKKTRDLKDDITEVDEKIETHLSFHNGVEKGKEDERRSRK